MAACRPNCRLYCLVADLDTARSVANDLWQTDVSARNLRVVTRRETPVAGLPEAPVGERTAIVEAAKRGLVIGSLAGAVTGLIAAVELPANFVFGCGLVLIGGVAGSALGAWVSAMMGIDRPHPEISQYQSAIDSGRVLVVVDVDREQLEPIEHLIRRSYPGARVGASRDMAASPPRPG